VEFRVLGPLEVRDGGRELRTGGPKQRALLAVLLLNANLPVSRDGLIEALWGERPPASAAHTLDAYVSRLRTLLGRERLLTRPPGYLVRVEPGELDLDRFAELAALGRRQLADDAPEDAGATLRAGLALWRGRALADVLLERPASDAADRLDELRLAAVEDRVDADLACGRAADLVGELEQLVAEHPFRERLIGQLMLALYRSGQQARALETYRQAKHRLASELGLDPGLALRDLERDVLAHDPALATPERAAPRRPTLPRGRRRLALGLAGLLVAATAVAAAVAALLAGGGTSAFEVTAANQAVALTLASAQPAHAVSLTNGPTALVSGFGSLWAADAGAGTVVRLDPRSRSVVDTIPVGGTPGALATGGGSVWVASVPGDRIARIDPASGTVTQTVPLGGAQLTALAFGAGALWVADATDESLLEVDPSAGTVRRTLTLSVDPAALVATDAAIWVADYEEGTVTAVDRARGNVLDTVRVGSGPTALAAVPGAVWVANALDSTVSRIATAKGAVAATIPVGSGPTAVVHAGGSIWVANQYSATVSRIDPARNAVVRTTAVGGGPTSLAASADHLWVGTRSLASHRGGRLTVLHTRPITIDPALQTDLLPLVSDWLTRDTLVTFAHVPGPAGTRLVPDLAVDVPVATDGGRSYTFRLRPGIRYSDGRPVRGADFRRAIERTFRLGSELRVQFAGLVGADACTRRDCDLSRGVVGDERARTVTFHLRAPDPDLITSLTSAAGGPVPAGTPWQRASKPIPGTGPYEIASASTEEIRWVRNPRFREWSHAARPDGNPDEIVLRFGLSPEEEVREVEAGRADALVDNIPAHLLPGLRRRHPGRIHHFVIPTTDFFQLNTNVPPFDDVRVRRALNYAIDRKKIVRLYGGSQLAAPTCQVLPPGVPGFERYCPYTRDPAASGVWRAPDLARARALVAASKTRGVRITVWGTTDDPTITPAVVRYVGGVLRSLGYPVRVRLVSHTFFGRRPDTFFRRIQLKPAAWGGDTPQGFFATWFACDGAQDHGWFCDPHLDRLNARARALNATSSRAAAALWAKLDRELVDRAVWLPMVNERGIDFVSARVRNYQSHPYAGIIADQLWVR
jgi:YVTN family beta-propeller protein